MVQNIQVNGSVEEDKDKVFAPGLMAEFTLETGKKMLINRLGIFKWPGKRLYDGGWSENQQK